MMRRLLPVLLLTASAFAADAPLPYGPMVFPEAKIEVVATPRTATLAIEALARTTDVPTRVRFTGDLGLIHNDTAHAALVKLLQDPEPLIRAEAIRALGSGTEIAAMIADTSPLVRREVVLAAPEEAVLLKAISDSDADVQNEALAHSASEKTDAALAFRLATATPAEQAIICQTLGERKAVTNTPAIEPLLTAAPILSRVAAIRSLAAMQKITAAQLTPQLSHPHPAVRVAGVTALAALPAAERLPLATSALGDADVGVRTAAAVVVTDVGTAATVAPLVANLNDDDIDLTAATRAALVAIAGRDPAARDALDTAAAELLAVPKPLMRVNGSYLLGALKSKTQLPRHIELLKDTDWRVVKQAAISLGQIGDPSAAPALAEVAQRSVAALDANATATPGAAEEMAARFSAGEQAVLACVALNYPQVIDDIKSIVPLRTGPIPVRQAVVWAIGVMQPPETAAPALKVLIGRTNDEMESQDVVQEAIKAAGNARATSLVPALTALRDKNEWPVTGIAAVALDRINGTQTPFAPPNVTSSPLTAIRDLTPAAK